MRPKRATTAATSARGLVAPASGRPLKIAALRPSASTSRAVSAGPRFVAVVVDGHVGAAARPAPAPSRARCRRSPPVTSATVSVSSAVHGSLLSSRDVSGDHRGREGGCRDERRRAAQARQGLRGHDHDVGVAAARAERALVERRAHDRARAGPRPRDLAADVDARRVDRVDDRGEPEAEVAARWRAAPRRRARRRRAAREIRSSTVSAATSAGMGLPGSSSRPEVARDRREVRDVRLPAAARCRRRSAARRAPAARGRTRRPRCAGRAAAGRS